MPTNLQAASRHPFKQQIERGEAAPLHPGEILRVDLLPYHRLSALELSRRLQMPSRFIDDLLAERTNVTADLAERLGAVFALPSRYWLALQMQFDLWQALAASKDA